MKTLYIECNMGIAGDMLVGSLLDLLDDNQRQEAIATVKSLEIQGAVVNVRNDKKMGITGTKFDVIIDRHNHHCHRTMDEIMALIDAYSTIDEKTKTDAKAIYRLIAKAESKVHGVDVAQIHLHEIGMIDAIIDITSACYLINLLGAKVIASPITTGYGSVNTAHGILSVPAPATALLLKDIPINSGDIEGELCTPTGVAIIKYYATDFTKNNDMTVSSVGVGLGTKDFERSNCLRAFLSKDDDTESVVELRCQIDDMTGEEMGFAIEKLLSLGALDAYVKPIVMKKSRPAMELTVITTPENSDSMAKQVFKHTTTIGIRKIQCLRYAMKREIQELNQVHIKRSSYGNITKEKPEFDDLAKIANEKDISIFEAKKLL